MIPIYQPDINPKDIEHAYKVLKTGWVSSIGEYIDLSKNKLSEIIGTKHTILVNNGTSATHLLAHAISYKRPSVRNILVPDNVYIAAWNAFQYVPRFNLIPVRSDLSTWNVDLNFLIDLAKVCDPNDTAILVVHNLGNPVDVPRLCAELPKFAIVEDNCEGLFGKYNNSYTGTASLASSLSFYGNKNITSGEGGAVTTNDDELAEYLYAIRGQGQLTTRFVHHMLGHNYRMTNVQAALLYGQLERYDQIMAKKRLLFDRYREAFHDVDVGMQVVNPFCEHSCWMFGIRVYGNGGYEKIRNFMSENGIDTRPMFYPMSAHKHLCCWARKYQELNSVLLNKECLMLPSSPNLTVEQIGFIRDKVVEFIK
jgi:perosamine synthetase